VGRVSEGHKLPMCLGAQADEQHVFVEGLSDTQLSGAMTCEEAGLVQASVLTLMQTWTLLVREENSDASVVAKAAELGIDVSAKIHTVEGVERHWAIDSVRRATGRGASATRDH
jgi:hypothetical protein